MDANPDTQREVVVLGRIAGAHGIKGWVKVLSDTEPRGAIFDYQPWLLGQEQWTRRVVQGRSQGKFLVAELEGVGDRDRAQSLNGLEIAVFRDQLPELPVSQYYWTDLIGLNVVNQDGAMLGSVKEMIATGANDVMVVQGEKERLIPFTWNDCVQSVDLGAKRVTVIWDPVF